MRCDGFLELGKLRGGPSIATVCVSSFLRAVVTEGAISILETANGIADRAGQKAGLRPAVESALWKTSLRIRGRCHT